MANADIAVAQRAVARGLIGAGDLAACRAAAGDAADERRLLELLVERGLLTRWQVAQLEAGRTQNLVLGRYILLAPLGAGGMGAVYRARDPDSDREVAVKVLPSRLATTESVARFRREALAALQMRHEHVVAAYEVGEQGALHFLVMELVDGPSLAAHLDAKKRLSVATTARIGYEVALALEHARGLGIVHRDIKPSNILLSRQGQVKVADMGLAKFFGRQSQAGDLSTNTGQFMGTINYCAPEQAVDAKRADIRSDIYSLGCTLYHCLTGAAPFAEGTEVQRIMAHIEILPAHIRLKNRDVPAGLAELIETRMLAKDAGGRFQTPAEAADALAQWAGKGVRNPWADLSPLEDLLDEAARAPALAPQRERVTAPLRQPTRPQPALHAPTSRATEGRRGPKEAGVPLRTLGYAVLVLAILGTITVASLWWTGKGNDDLADAETSTTEGRETASAGQAPGAAASDGGTTFPGGPPDGLGSPSHVGSEDETSTDEAPTNVPSAGGNGSGVIPGAAALPTPSDSSPAAPVDTSAADKEPIKAAPAPQTPGLLLTVKHDGVVAVAVSADGSTLVTGGNKTAQVWDAANGAPRGAPLIHESSVTSVSLSADGRHVVTELSRQRLEEGGLGFVPSKQGRTISLRSKFIAVSRSRTSILWGPTAERDRRTPLLTAIPGPIAFTTDGKTVLVMNTRSVVTRIPGYPAGDPVYDRSRSWYDQKSLRFEWHELPAIAAARGAKPLESSVDEFFYDSRGIFSPDSGLYATVARPVAKQPWVVRFWDTHTGKLRGQPATLPENQGNWQYAFRGDSRALAIFGSKPTLRLFEVPTGRVLKDIELSEPAYRIAFHPAGDLLVVCVGGTVELRDAETGAVRGPSVPIQDAMAAAYSPDGRRLFVGKGDGTAELWDLEALRTPAGK